MSSNSAKNAHILAIIACVLASLFYCYEFFIRLMPTTMTDELMAFFNMDHGLLGLLGGAFFWGYAPMQIPAGLILDRIGAKKTLAFAMVFCSLGTFLFALTSSFSLACLSRFIIGISASFAYPGTLLLAAKAFKPKFFTSIVGIVQLFGSTGAIIGVGPVAYAVSHWGWQATVNFGASVGLALALLFWFATKNLKTQIAPHNPEYNAHNEWSRLKNILQNKQSWAVGLFSFTIWGPISVFATFWCVPFLTEQGYSMAQASLLDSCIWIGVALGGPILGAISNIIGKRRIPIAFCSITAICTASTFLYLPHPSVYTLGIAMFFFGVAASGQAVTFGIVQDMTPLSIQGTAFGFNNMAIVMGGVMLTPLVGGLVEIFSGFLPLTEAYKVALSVIPICSLTGLFTSIFLIKETNCTTTYKNN